MATTTDRTRRGRGSGRRWRRGAAGVAVAALVVTLAPSAASAEGMTCVGNNCEATYVAVSPSGNATATQGVAVSPSGTATSNGPTGVAVSGTNQATGNGATGVAASGTGNANGPVAVSGLGYTDASLVGVSGQLTWVESKDGPVPVGATVQRTRELLEMVVAGLANVVEQESAALVPSDPERYLSDTIFAGEGSGCAPGASCSDLELNLFPLVVTATVTQPLCYGSNPDCGGIPMLTYEHLWAWMSPQSQQQFQWDVMYNWTTVTSDNAGICGIRQEWKGYGASTDVNTVIYDMYPDAGNHPIDATGSTGWSVGGGAFGFNGSYSSSTTTWKGRVDADKTGNRFWAQWSNNRGECPWWNRHDSNSTRPTVSFKSGTVFLFNQPPGNPRSFRGNVDIMWNFDRCCA